jgi:hypothetical protein
MPVLSVASKIDYKQLCMDLLCAESEAEVTKLLDEHGLLAPAHWKVLGDMPNNRSMVDNQQNDPAGALVEKIVNGMDAMLTKGCFLKRIDPESAKAPSNMSGAAELFFGVKGGDLANLSSARGGDLTKLAENIQLVATGTKSEPCYLIVDQGEGQTPERFENTFLSLKRSNKAKIHFVQGKFNCGGTGVLPFCGKNSYQLIVSKRCPELPSGSQIGEARDPSHSLWGFTLIRALPASQGIFDTKTYVYLAPSGKVPTFDAKEIKALSEISPNASVEDSEAEGDSNGSDSANNTPRPYARGLSSGTVIKLYDYRWPSRGVATLEARFALEKYLYKLCLPFRVVESRAGYEANYYATTVAGTAVTISNDRKKGYLEFDPLGGEICPEGIGSLPIFIALYREKTEDLTGSDNSKKKRAKDSRRLPKGLSFTINGQVHYSLDSTFFVTRGLKYEFIKDTLVVVVDCTGLPEDVRDCLVMPSRDRLRKLAEFDNIIESVVADLKYRELLRQANDERKLRRVKAALEDGATQDVFQHLVNKDPVLASLFGNGIRLRNPWFPGAVKQEYKGKLPPTFFHFEGGKSHMDKSFAIDRTCTVELETDAINGYFELPDPDQRGGLVIEPQCYERWSLMDGKLRIVFRAPSNARIGDSLPVSITVADPLLTLRGDPPWSNTVRLSFTEGGKEVKPGPKGKKREATGSLAMPDVQQVFRGQWGDHDFDEKSGLRITTEEGGSYRFWVNMDNTYLHNELMQKKDAEKEATKFAYKWGLVLIAMGMIQELKKGQDAKSSINGDSETEEAPRETLEDLVRRVSSGVAAVIIPTVLHLMDAMKDMGPAEQLS